MAFKNVKKQILEGSDLSRKGSVDELILELVNYLNSFEDYVTTSSCSGRVILFTAESSCGDTEKKHKKDCKWLFTSHSQIEADALIGKIDPGEGDLQFKFEPFILHVQCSGIEKAKQLHTIAIGCGFRESGLTVGRHGKITLAIRSNIRLEVPLSQDGVMLVSDVYLKFLAELANEKLKTNEMKIKNFFTILKEQMGKSNRIEEKHSTLMAVDLKS